MSNKINYTLLFILFFLFTFSQNEEGVRKATFKEAEEKYIAANYEEALDDFLNLLAQDSKNDQYKYKIAVCYLNTNIDKTKAIPYLEILTHKPKCDHNIWYLLGRAYHYANRFDDALATYNKFKLANKGITDNLKDVDKQIQYCLNAKELMKYPNNVTFENVGDKINSSYNDHFAFVPVDESFIVFNTNRPEKNSQETADGSYKNSIYFSKEKLGVFAKATNIGAPISSGNLGEEVVGLSSNGEYMILYIKDKKGIGNLYLSQQNVNGTYTNPIALDKTIDSDYDEIAAAITQDGLTIYFASNRPGGFGGTDLYMSKKLSNGKYGEAINLGKDINTMGDEDFPDITPDKKTLYFSSNGHTSMGGYDIFHANWNEDSSKFINVKNIGYPISTTLDDNNFRVSYSGRFGYISAIRSEGFGDYDIYRVTFNEVEPQLCAIHGHIKSEEASKIEYQEVYVTVINLKGQIIGNYVPNLNTGAYIIILPPGKYSIKAETTGFKTLTKQLEIFDKGSFRSEIELDLQLLKIK